MAEATITNAVYNVIGLVYIRIRTTRAAQSTPKITKRMITEVLFIACVAETCFFRVLQNYEIFPNQPRAMSSAIIRAKPIANPMVPRFECSPRDASGISSSITT